MGREKQILKDSRGRTLKDGERQKPDGRYEYRYTDGSGKRRSVYSWRLLASDKTPSGRKDAPPLRQMERSIMKDLEEGLDMDGGDISVYQLVHKYVSLRKGVTENTRAGYRTTLKIIEKHPFGKKKIKSVRTLDAKEFLRSLQEDDGRSYSSIHSIRGVLRPAFKMAEDDELIKKNPFNFCLADWVTNDSKRREAITPEQERAFLKFIKEDEHFGEHYYSMVYLLFNTGLRVSEFCGLTMDDIDFEGRMIRVNKQLQCTHKGGVLYIEDPEKLTTQTKTKAGMRYVPMRANVCELLKKIVEERKANAPETEPEVDGYSGFLFLNQRARKGLRPYIGLDLAHIFKHALEKYNSTYKKELPKITPHVCRHTFCTKMVRQLMEPTRLQLIMGHSDISVTLGYYTHTRAVDAKASMEEVDAKLKDDPYDFF